MFASVLLAFFVRTFLFQAFVVPSSSMEDTVLVGDHLLVNKFVFAAHGPWLASLLPYRAVRRGDVFVFKFPEDPRRDFIKRAVGLPGDLLELRDRVVSINGDPQQEPRARHSDPRVWPDDPSLSERLRRRDQLPATRIPDGTYFAMGDNRDNSSDSRFWGPVPAQNLKGRALLIYWSLSPSAPEETVAPIPRVFTFPARTRWSRLFRLVR